MFLSVPVTGTKIRKTIVSDAETAASASETSTVSASETAVSDAETAVLDAETAVSAPKRPFPTANGYENERV